MSAHNSPEQFRGKSSGGDGLKEPFARFIEAKLGSGALFITCGLPVTGKTRMSQEISRIKGYPIVRTDVIRREVLKNDDIFDEKVASDMDKRMMVYNKALQQAEEIVGKGDGVIIDATFFTQPLRRRAAAIAAKHNQVFVILQTQCPRAIAIERILRRTRENYESNALTEQSYINNEKAFEKVDLDDLKRSNPNLDIVHLIVDTQYDAPKDWYIVGIEEI
jgi:predicted kinase